MGFLGDITLGGVKGLMEGAGSLAKDIRSAVTGEISPEKKAELLQKATELESQGMLAQAEINKIEAASPNMFVSGARPAAMWVCVFGFAYNFLICPILTWASLNFQWTVPPSINPTILINLLMAMLGLAGYRTAEKFKGVQRN